MHTFDAPLQQVSLPPNIRNHGLCSLSLCPLRVIVKAEGGSDYEGMSLDPIKHESRTPIKNERVFCEDQYSSSPRDEIKKALSILNAPGSKPYKRYRRSNLRDLPRLTGTARERFKLQK